MAEILSDWLRARLGVIIDLTPEIFGHHCRDGTFLAKLLHSYAIINDSQLSTIIRTQDPALARVNLRHLSAWLKFIGVDCDNECIENISNGKGTAALHLFYKLFLCLENKDRLHFITLQKEREKYIPNSMKFDVQVVPEEEEPCQAVDPLPSLLVRNASLIEWHRSRFQKIMEDSKRVRGRFYMPEHSKETLKKTPTNVQPKAAKKHQVAEQEETSRKFKTKAADKKPVEEPKKQVPPASDPEAEIIRALNKRKEEFKNKVLTELFEKLENEQDRFLDELVARKVLEQSRFEKQMIKKLCDIRSEKLRIAANRNLVEDLMQKRRETEARLVLELEEESKLREKEEIDDECRRMNELQQRLKDEAQKKLEQEVIDVVGDILDVSLAAVQFRQLNKDIPESLWNEWKTLFQKNYPIFELNHFEDETTKNKFNERDFDNYKDVKPPWDKFLPKLDDKSVESFQLGINILAHIVYRLFDIVYPHPTELLKPKLPYVKVRGALVGVTDSAFYNPMMEQLKLENIRLIRVEDAINFCLKSYKDEMKDYCFIDLTTESKSKKTYDNTNQMNGQSIIDMDFNNKSSDSITRSLDKCTQTPKVIPFDDTHPFLSDAAYIGKLIHEFFLQGEAISEYLAAKTITEYLKSMNNIRGWVLFNYPNTFNQLIHLESALSGTKPPEHVINVEETSARINVNMEQEDPFALERISQLLPHSSTQETSPDVQSTLTIFLKVVFQSARGKLSVESLKIHNDSTDVEKFYADQGVAAAIHYTNFDSSVLEKIVKHIVGKSMTSSEQLQSFPNKVSSSTKSNDQLGSSKFQMNVKPGELGWRFADLPISFDVASSLSSFWKKLEASYVNEIKESLFFKRFNYTSIVSYKDSITQLLLEHIKQPDNRQEILEEFKLAFNEVTDDIRSNPDGKVELNNRVADFQTILWDLCDKKKEKCEEERRNIINDHWVVDQLVNVTNVHLEMIQSEANFFFSCLYAARYYYLAMLQKRIEDDHPMKIVLQKLSFYPEKLAKPSNSSLFGVNLFDEPSPKPGIQEDQMKNEITNYLLNVEADLNPAEVSCFKIIQFNLEYITFGIDKIFNWTVGNFDDLKRIDLKKLSVNSGSFNSKMYHKTSSNQILNDYKMEDFILEWKTLIDYLNKRVKLRLEMIKASIKWDINFILKTIKNTFQNLQNTINERYQKEICSVDELINIFTKAIEKEKSIPEKLILRGENLIIRSISKNSDGLILLSSIGEKLENVRFTVNQLKELKYFFQDLAPAGWIAKQSLVHNIQDLLDDNGNKYDVKSPLPSCWYTFDSRDIDELISELFLEEDPIDWREFLIYALNIEMPSVEELLKARETFSHHDESLSEVINKNQCLLLPFWFVGSKKCLSTTLKQKNAMNKSVKRSISFKVNSEEDVTRSGVQIDMKETPRMSSTREFLCELFSTDNEQSIDYMTMLFSFCKDHNPKTGLGKALSLSLGKKVCWDYDEGENYLDKLLGNTTSSARRHRNGDQDNVQFVRKYLNVLVNNLETREMLTDVDNVSLMDEAGFYTKSRSLIIETLDEPGKYVPDDVSANLSSSSITEHFRSTISSQKSFTFDKDRDFSRDFNDETVFWIPIDTCKTVLSNLISPKVFDIHFKMSFNDFINEISNDVKCEEVNSDENLILSHRFVNHRLVERLIFEITNKFCQKSVGEVTKGILRRKKANKY